MVQLEASGLGILVREVLRAPAALEVLIMDFLVQLVWAVPTPVLIYVPEVAAVAPAGSVAVLVVMTTVDINTLTTPVAVAVLVLSLTAQSMVISA